MNRIQMRLGQAGIGLKELIATLVVSAILIVIGIFVYSKLFNNFARDSTYSSSSETLHAVSKTTYDAFTLTTVSLIVLAAATIIGILIRAFGA